MKQADNVVVSSNTAAKDRKRNTTARKFIIQRARRLKRCINDAYHMQDVSEPVTALTALQGETT